MNIRNQIIVGEIAYVRESEYLVDVSTGADVTLPFSEAIKEHKQGDTVHVVVYDKVHGEKFVSEKRAEKFINQTKYDEYINTDHGLKGTINSYNKGQFYVTLEGDIEGVCFIKNLIHGFINNPEEYIGNEYEFNIIGRSRNDFNKYELSRENITKKEQLERLTTFDSKFNVGDKYTGTVKSHLKSGINVDVDGFECFIPKSEISYLLNFDLPEVGTEVTFELIRKETERFNIVGSIKLTTIDPWTQTESLNTEDKYTGKISRVENYGVFVEVLPNIQGMIHIRDLSHDFIKDTAAFKLGDEIEFKIIDINNETKKLKLSAKALYPSKYQLAKERFTTNEHIVAAVSKFYRSGIFVKLMDSYDVFVKNEEIHNHTQTRPMLKIGDKMDFIITEMNDENEEIILSNTTYVEQQSKIFEEALENSN